MAVAVARAGQTVHVVGIGAQTPLGRTAPASAAAVRAGICRFREHAFMTDADGESMRVACVPWLAPDLPLEARVQSMICGAAEEAMSALPTSLPRSGRPAIAMAVGISDDRTGLPPRWRQALTDGLLGAFRDRLGTVDLELHSSGHAAGVLAIQRGCQLLLDGTLELCLVGGADSHIGPENLLELEARRQVHGEDNAWGFVPGEAAGFCLLSTEAAARKYGLPSLLEVVSVAVARESHTIRSRGVCTGAGLGQAVAQVLGSCRAEKVDVILSDQNGEPYRADEFGFTLARHARRFDAPPDFRAPAACWGDVGAASAPLFAGLIAASGLRGYAAGEHGLLLTSSDTGERGAILVRLGSSSRK